MRARFWPAFLLVCLALPVSSQIVPIPHFSRLPQVREFLDLTEEQVDAISQNNGSYNRWAEAKQRRIWQVQREIFDWTGAEPLDASQLGIRYAEIEMICRQMLAEGNRYRQLNLDSLSDAQRAKLEVLEEVLRLFSTASEARDANLVGTRDEPTPAFATQRWFSSGAYLGGPTVSGCRSPARPWGFIGGGIVRSPLPPQGSNEQPH